MGENGLGKFLSLQIGIYRGLSLVLKKLLSLIGTDIIPLVEVNQTI